MKHEIFFVLVIVCAAIMFAVCDYVSCETRDSPRARMTYLLRPLDSLSGDELRWELFYRHNEIIRNGFYLLKYNTQEEFAKMFGPPVKVERREVKNWHAPGEMDTKVDLFYDTMRVGLLLTGDASYLSGLFLTGKEYELIYGIKIGSRRDYIRKVLGEPYGTRKRGQVWYYTTEWPHNIYFYFDEDIVKSIEWSFAYYN